MQYAKTIEQINSKHGRKSIQLSSNLMKAVVIASTLLVVSACGSSGGGSSTQTNTAEAGTNTSGALSGAWGQCSGGFLFGYQFTGNRWKEVKGLFAAQNCTGPYLPDSGLHEFEFEGTYEIVGTTTSDSGLEVMQINMTSDRLEGEALFESAKVTRYNIVYTGTAGQLIMGDFTQNESARPTQLDFDAPYLQR